jgi:hypothetical protein
MMVRGKQRILRWEAARRFVVAVGAYLIMAAPIKRE